MTVVLEEGPGPDPAVDYLDRPPPRARRGRRAPWWLWLAAWLVLVPVAVPMAFLVADVLGSSSAAWDILFSTRTLQLIVRSLVFTAAVTAAAAVIGVAAAWITFRVELWGRRIWTVLVMLPLVIPSYVIALTLISFFGGRGLFAELTGVGLPSISGFWGAGLALTLSTYPYVFLITRTALRRVDTPAWRGGRPYFPEMLQSPAPIALSIRFGRKRRSKIGQFAKVSLVTWIESAGDRPGYVAQLCSTEAG